MASLPKAPKPANGSKKLSGVDSPLETPTPIETKDCAAATPTMDDFEEWELSQAREEACKKRIAVSMG